MKVHHHPRRRHPHPHLWRRRSLEDRTASLPPQHFSAWPGIMEPPPSSYFPPTAYPLRGGGAFQRLEGNRRGGEERDFSAVFPPFLENVGKEGRGGSGLRRSATTGAAIHLSFSLPSPRRGGGGGQIREKRGRRGGNVRLPPFLSIHHLDQNSSLFPNKHSITLAFVSAPPEVISPPAKLIFTLPSSLLIPREKGAGKSSSSLSWLRPLCPSPPLIPIHPALKALRVQHHRSESERENWRPQDPILLPQNIRGRGEHTHPPFPTSIAGEKS